MSPRPRPKQVSGPVVVQLPWRSARLAHPGKARRAWVFLRLLLDDFVKDRCRLAAAALTSQTLFALVPLLTVSYVLLSSLRAFTGAGEMIESFVFEYIVPENVSAVQAYLHSFADQARRLSIPSLLLLATTAFLMMNTIERTFNEIWQVREPRHGFRRLLVYGGVLTAGPFLLGTGLLATTSIFSLPLLGELAQSTGLLYLVVLLLGAVTFTLMYVLVPNCQVPLGHGVIGGLLVAGALECAKQLFVAVMAVSSFQVVYGTFAAASFFVLWVYVSWTLILFGAELVKALGRHRFGASGRHEPPLVQVLLTLELLFRCHGRGEMVTEEKIRRLAPRIDLELWPEVKDHLIRMNLIRLVDRDRLVLSRNLDEVTLWDLHLAMPWRLPAGLLESEHGWETGVTETFGDILAYNRRKLAMNLGEMFRADEQKPVPEGSE